MVPLDRHAIGYLKDRHAGGFGEKLGQGAFVLRGEVLDDDNGHSSPRGECLQKRRQGLQAARRSAHADNGERSRRSPRNGSRAFRCTGKADAIRVSLFAF